MYRVVKLANKMNTNSPSAKLAVVEQEAFSESRRRIKVSKSTSLNSRQ